MKAKILFISIAALVASCEDVIEVDLDSIDPKLVIEGSITDANNNCEIRLSMTSDYFSSDSIPMVTGASVLVSDFQGNVYQFEEMSPGLYLSDDLRGIENAEYQLEVNSEGKEYTAYVKMPQKVEIGGLSQIETPEYMEFTGGYLVNTHLFDPEGSKDFYRIKVYRIHDPNKGINILNVFDDAFVDGKEIVMQWDKEQFFPQDTVIVELQSLDESTYTYYANLLSLAESGFIGNANPANPETNISNDALGYFGAYTVSRDTIVISSNE